MFKLIYKELGISSFKAINDFAKKNNIKKIGHTGTLDVLAKGLLLVATDDDTKLIQYISNKTKEYFVSCHLGYVSRTYDQEGPIEFVSNEIPSRDEIEKTLLSFKGKQKQIPPDFSAKKINGQKAYELARKNKEIFLNEIDIEIFDIYNISYEYPYVNFNIHVSNGTYIRSLVNDIGQKLKVGAYMYSLERTKIHGLSIDDELKIDQLINLEEINIRTKDELKDWFNGKMKTYNLISGKYLLKFEKEIIGIIEIKNNKIINNQLFGNKIKKILSN